MTVTDNVTQRFAVPFTPRYGLFWSAYTLGGLAWSVALYGAARAVRAAPSDALERAREYLNPFYILHQTVIVVLAFYSFRAGAGPILTFAWTYVVSFAVTVALCALVKRPRLLRGLFGLRPAVALSARPQAAAPLYHGYL